MTGDLVKFHGGAMDGHSMQVPSGPDGPNDVMCLPKPKRPLSFREYDGPTRPGPRPLTYRRRLAMSDEDHAWHYDLEQP
jgi:hypothetical protein